MSANIRVNLLFFESGYMTSQHVPTKSVMQVPQCEKDCWNWRSDAVRMRIGGSLLTKSARDSALFSIVLSAVVRDDRGLFRLLISRFLHRNSLILRLALQETLLSLTVQSHLGGN